MSTVKTVCGNQEGAAKDYNAKKGRKGLPSAPGLHQDDKTALPQLLQDGVRPSTVESKNGSMSDSGCFKLPLLVRCGSWSSEKKSESKVLLNYGLEEPVIYFILKTSLFWVG